MSVNLQQVIQERAQIFYKYVMRKVLNFNKVYETCCLEKKAKLTHA